MEQNGFAKKQWPALQDFIPLWNQKYFTIPMGSAKKELCSAG